MGRSDYSCFSRDYFTSEISMMSSTCTSYGVYGALLLEFVCFHRNSYPCDYVTEVEGRVNKLQRERGKISSLVCVCVCKAKAEMASLHKFFVSRIIPLYE